MLCSTVVILLLPFSVVALSQGHPPPRNDNRPTSRRDVMSFGIAAAAGGLVLSSPVASAAPPSPESMDLAAFKLVGASAQRLPSIVRSTVPRTTVIQSRDDPPPLLSIRGGRSGESTLRIPRVGYSLYKTKPEEVTRCVRLALRCGIRHFDTATQYGSIDKARVAFDHYLEGGSSLMRDYADEEPELLQALDDANAAGQKRAMQTGGYRSLFTNIDGSAGQRGRRNELFISHKLSNNEQSTDVVVVKRHVKDAIAKLGVGYLDMISIHSPLTDPERRIGTYRALLELRDAGFVRSVGVCNYGIGPLEEIHKFVGVDVLGNVNIGNLPAINQLELSPFNAHGDVVRYCELNGIAVGCSAWSKLSGVDGPAEGWGVLATIAKSRGMTMAQLLVRWSLQKGFVCVPRSGSSSKVERLAIAENSFGGVNPGDDSSLSFVLSEDDMTVINSLDVGYKAGKLGRRDGWEDGDVLGPDWDPTDYI